MPADGLKTVADVDAWVRQHGYLRFKQALLAGEFKGSALRAARAWLLFRHDRRRRAAARGIVTLVTVLGAACIFYWLPR